MKLAEFKNVVQRGELKGKLAHMYCCDTDEVGKYEDRLLACSDRFSETFTAEDDREIIVVSAPGRTEIGGNHTDHQRGKVLTGSVNVDALCFISRNGTETANVFSEGYGMLSVDVSDTEIREADFNTTSALVRGVCSGLSQEGYVISGFDAYIVSDVPGGSGLSSSACFEVLIGFALNALYCGNEVDAVKIARIGQFAENKYFGKPSGLMDQMGCAVGGVVAIDFADADDPKYRHIDFDFAKAGYTLCIIDSGADHADLTDDYSAMPREMKEVASFLGADVLSQADEERFWASIPEIRKVCGDRAVLRAYHYFEDCRRVDREVDALSEGDFRRFLETVRDSGRSSFMYLQNISTYRDPADQPVAIALAAAEKALHGEGAVRVHGGGFAGTIQAFVPAGSVDEFRRNVDRVLGQGACKVMNIRPVGGTVIAG